MTKRVGPVSPEMFGLVTAILGPKAMEFAKAELGRAGTLGRKLDEHFSIFGGEIITFLPKDATRAAYESFESCCAVDTQQMYSSTHQLAMALTKQYLTQSQDQIVIFNTLARPSDPWLLREKLYYFSYGSEVYLYLSAAHSSDEEIQAAFKSYGSYPAIVAFASKQPSLHPRNRYTIGQVEINNLASDTFAVMIEAYDQDGFLLWKRGR